MRSDSLCTLQIRTCELALGLGLVNISYHRVPVAELVGASSDHTVDVGDHVVTIITKQTFTLGHLVLEVH